MPVNGGSRGPSGNSNFKSHNTHKGDGPGANRADGASRGGPGFKAAGMSGGKPDNLRNGSPMKGPSPSMGSVLKYIRTRGSGEDRAPGSGEGAPLGKETSPYPTGGEPLPQHDQGDDVPGESHLEAEMEGDCGHPGCTKHGKKPSYDQSNKETRQFGKGR